MESKGFRENGSRGDVIRIYVDYSAAEKKKKDTREPQRGNASIFSSSNSRHKLSLHYPSAIRGYPFELSLRFPENEH